MTRDEMTEILQACQTLRTFLRQPLRKGYTDQVHYDHDLDRVRTWEHWVEQLDEENKEASLYGDQR